MLSTLSNKRILIALLIVVILIATLIVYVVVLSSQTSYVGTDAKLSKVDKTSSLQISNVVMSMPPKVETGVQANIQVTKFAGNYAQGIVSYSNKSPSQHFMATKVDGNWTIVTHNAGKSLHLPDIKTAEKFSLPTGWFEL